MAEVRALAMRGKSGSSQGASSQGGSSQGASPPAQANAARFGNNGNRGNSGKNYGGGKCKKNRGNKRSEPYGKEKGGQGKTMAVEGTLTIPTSTAPIIKELATPSLNVGMPRRRTMAPRATAQAATRKGMVATMDLDRVNPSLLINRVFHSPLILIPATRSVTSQT
jgi:hypothetical protein